MLIVDGIDDTFVPPSKNQIVKVPIQITVFSPSTIANVGCGYDVLGFALDGIGEKMTVSSRDDGKLVIAKNKKFNLPTNPKKMLPQWRPRHCYELQV